MNEMFANFFNVKRDAREADKWRRPPIYGSRYEQAKWCERYEREEFDPLALYEAGAISV